jgi:hydrogenase maturation factor
MCLGIPAQLVDRDTGHLDLAAVDMGGVTRVNNMACSTNRSALSAGNPSEKPSKYS